MMLASHPVLARASSTVLKTGRPRCCDPPLPGVTPPTMLVPYSIACCEWKVPWVPVKPWQITLVALLTRIDMVSGPPLHGVDDLAGGVRQGGRGDDGQAGFLQDLAPQLDIGAFEPHHQRAVEADLARGADDAFGDGIAAHHAAEHVDQDPLHAWIVEDQLEGAGDALLGGGACY